MKSIGIMQPYFLPYIGYYQLINTVDEFVIYDNIQFTKKGWINRNRILENGADTYITLPLKKDSDFLNINERFLADNYNEQKIKMLNKIKNNYGKAPFFETAYPLIERIFNYNEKNLFNFIHYSLIETCNFLQIKTPIKTSSSLEINNTLKAAEKVKAITEKQKANIYINPIGGLDLYDTNDFEKVKIKLKFIKTNKIEYKQFKNEFVHSLSILDVIMFNDKENIKKLINKYELI